MQEQTDANRTVVLIKEAFNDAKARHKEYTETLKRLEKERVQAFYEKTVREILEFYNNFVPPFKVLDIPATIRTLIPQDIHSLDALSIFMDHGFDVKTDYDKSKNSCYLIFNFATK